MRDLTVQREFRDPDRDERMLFFVRSAKPGNRRKRRFSEKDVSLLLLHGALGLAAMAAPPAQWPGLCRLTSLPRAARHGRQGLSRFSEMANDVLGLHDPAAISDLYRATHRRLHERHMTYLRERFSRHGVETGVAGLDHLRRSLEGGAGAMLWVTPALGDTILTKRALAAAGVPAWQLSVRSHGFSQTRFGVRHINPRQIAVEDGYLAGRIWFEGEDALSATREVMRRLKQNLPVLFTNSLFSGRAFVGVPAGSSYVLPLPTTPLSIAARAGVPLHVVTTIEKTPFSRYVTVISEALSADGGPAKPPGDDARIAALALRARDIIVGQLRADPDQLRLWDRLVERARFGAGDRAVSGTEHDGA